MYQYTVYRLWWSSIIWNEAPHKASTMEAATNDDGLVAQMSASSSAAQAQREYMEQLALIDRLEDVRNVAVQFVDQVLLP